MKNLLKINLFILISVSSFSASIYSAEVVAKKNKVKVYSEANKKSTVLKKLNKGESLNVIKRKGMYWEVNLDGKSAFIYVLKVKRRSTDSGGISSKIRKMVKDDRSEDQIANSRSRSAVMGVRGAVEDEDSKFAGNVKPNLRAVYMMEDFETKEVVIEKLEKLIYSEIRMRSKKSS